MRAGRVTVPRRPDRQPREPGEDHRRLGALVQQPAADAPPRATAPGRGRRRVPGQPGLTPTCHPGFRPPAAGSLTLAPRRGPPPAAGPGGANPAPPPGKATGPRQVKPGSPTHPAATGRTPPGRTIESVQNRHRSLLFTQDQVRIEVGDFHSRPSPTPPQPAGGAGPSRPRMLCGT